MNISSALKNKFTSQERRRAREAYECVYVFFWLVFSFFSSFIHLSRHTALHAAQCYPPLILFALLFCYIFFFVCLVFAFFPQLISISNLFQFILCYAAFFIISFPCLLSLSYSVFVMFLFCGARNKLNKTKKHKTDKNTESKMA